MYPSIYSLALWVRWVQCVPKTPRLCTEKTAFFKKYQCPLRPRLKNTKKYPSHAPQNYPGLVLAPFWSLCRGDCCYILGVFGIVFLGFNVTFRGFLWYNSRGFKYTSAVFQYMSFGFCRTFSWLLSNLLRESTTLWVAHVHGVLLDGCGWRALRAWSTLVVGGLHCKVAALLPLVQPQGFVKRPLPFLHHPDGPNCTAGVTSVARRECFCLFFG